MKDYIGQLDTSLLSDPIINPAWPSNERAVGDISLIVVHHSADTEGLNYDDRPLYEQEAEYQNHTSIPDSQGLQYHYKIDNVGAIMQTRPLTTYLWHCGDLPANKTSLAICLDGDFETGHQSPTREQYEALKQLLDNLSTQHPEFPAVQSDVWPHRHFFNTNCCGDNLVPFVQSYQTNNGNVGIPDVPYQHPELQPVPPAPAPEPDPTPPPAPEPAPVPPVPSAAPVASPSPSAPPVTTTPLPDPAPIPPVVTAPLSPIDHFIKWLLNLLFGWVK